MIPNRIFDCIDIKELLAALIQPDNSGLCVVIGLASATPDAFVIRE